MAPRWRPSVAFFFYIFIIIISPAPRPVRLKMVATLYQGYTCKISPPIGVSGYSPSRRGRQTENRRTTGVVRNCRTVPAAHCATSASPVAGESCVCNRRQGRVNGRLEGDRRRHHGDRAESTRSRRHRRTHGLITTLGPRTHQSAHPHTRTPSHTHSQRRLQRRAAQTLLPLAIVLSLSIFPPSLPQGYRARIYM